jgi:alpha-mannosidase
MRMTQRKTTLWQIGSADKPSPDLVDNYKNPNMLGDVIWQVKNAGSHELSHGLENDGQKWPVFHPSEADPEGGYQFHPYRVRFELEDDPTGTYTFRLDYLVIAPRLADLKLNINGVEGVAYLRPSPSDSGEIRLLEGLHTTIYSEGVCEVMIPKRLLHKGLNELTLVSCDGKDYVHVDNRERIGRLDRMANGAGFVYQGLSLTQTVYGDAASPHTVHGDGLATQIDPSDTVSHQADPAWRGICNVEMRPTVMYRRDKSGDLVEKCQFYVEFDGPTKGAVLRLELSGNSRTQTTEVAIPALSFGHFRSEFEVFDGTGAVEYRLHGTIDGRPVDFKGWFVRRRKWKVYLSPHAHTDVGYTHRQWEVAERLCRNIDTAIDHLEQAPSHVPSDSFSYHLDSTWVLETYLVTRAPDRIKKLVRHIREGSIGIPSNYADVLTQYAGLEDLIRNGEFTESFLRPNGLRSEFASVVDVASLTGSLPAILEHSGVRYLVHANNQDRGPFRLNGGLNRISPYYWEGTNGGKVLTWLAKMYCELRKVCGSPPMQNAAERGLDLWLLEYESESYAPDAVILYGQEADNTDIDLQPSVFTAQWNETYEYPRLIPCNVSDFFHYVEENFGHRLVTVKGDGGAYWEDGVGSSIVPTIENRRAQGMILAAERLEALAALHNPDFAYPQGHFDDAWRELLQYDEHTWGAFLSCTDPDALLQNHQWAVKEHMAKQAAAWGRRLLHSAATRHSLMWNTKGREIAVYNPHSWGVSGFVQVEIGRGEKVTDAQSGADVAHRVVRRTHSQKVVELWISHLDGLSYRRFPLQAADESEQQQEFSTRQASGRLTLENQYYHIVIDTERGGVVSILDKDIGRELVDQTDQYRFGQLLYAEGGEGTRLVSNQSDLPEADLHLHAGFDLIAASVEEAEGAARVVIKGQVPMGLLTVEWRLVNGQKRIDVRYTYDKTETVNKEAVYIAFPTALTNAMTMSDSHLGWVDWNKDSLPGACKEWLPLQTGIHVSETDGGPGARSEMSALPRGVPRAEVFIASPDIPLFCIGDIVRGRWPKELDLSGGCIFSYVLNNYWHTNYKASQGGEIEFSYQITSAEVITKEAAYRCGWEARMPLYAQRLSLQEFRTEGQPYAEDDGGTLAVLGGLHVPGESEGTNIALTTLKKAKWDEGFILRLQETAGETAHVKLNNLVRGHKLSKAWHTDLLERDIEEIRAATDGSLIVPVPAWGLATIRFITE